MKSPSRMTQGRQGHTNFSLQKTWGVLVSLVLILFVMEFRYMWHQVDSPVSETDINALHELLREGYSYSGASNVLVEARRSRLKSGPVRSHSEKDDIAEMPNTNELEGDKASFLELRPAADKESEEDTVTEKAAPADEGKSGGRLGSSGDFVITEQHLRYIQKMEIKSHDKWIVLDVTYGGCTGNVSLPAGWKTLVIGSAQHQIRCKLPYCMTLGPDLNSTLSAEASGAWWKNLAYLTALSHGAHLILDADCTVPLAEAVAVLKLSSAGRDHGMMYNETLLFNPYAHFGAWAASPRSLARSDRERLNNSRLYFIRDFDHVMVKHALSEQSHDIVTDSGRRDASGASFDRSAPPVFLGQRSFSAAIPACSVYSRDAAWGLLLPCLSQSIRCHVMRQLLSQRLLREVDAFSGFYQIQSTSAAGQFSEPNDGQTFDAYGFVSYLDAWKCASNLTFFGCMDTLAEDVFKKGKFINQYEMSLMKSWIIALQKTAWVVEPTRANVSWRGVRKIGEVRMTFGSVLSQLDSGGSKAEHHLRTQCAGQVKTSCNESVDGVNWFPVAQWRKPLITEVVLIVVFNSNRFFWNNLPFLETMHRPFFRHIVYCVPNVDQLLAGGPSEEFQYLTTIEGQSDQWYLMYECLTTASRINIQGVRGFLQIGDDTLLNTWLLFNMPRDSMWMPHGFTTVRGEESSHRWGWYWWRKSRGRPAVLHAMADLERISGMSSEQLLNLDPNINKTRQSQKHRTAATFSELYKKGRTLFPPMHPALPGAEAWDQPSKQDALRFLNNYYRANRMLGLLTHRAMDLFYIPQALIETFVKFSRYFMGHGVIIELAVPTIHYGLTRRSDVKYVKGRSLWEGDRNITFSFYSNSTFFLHPFKMKANMAQKQSRNLFCQVYMKTLFMELFKRIER